MGAAIGPACLKHNSGLACRWYAAVRLLADDLHSGRRSPPLGYGCDWLPKVTPQESSVRLVQVFSQE